jgi:hypothetical protein
MWKWEDTTEIDLTESGQNIAYPATVITPLRGDIRGVLVKFLAILIYQ